MKQEKVFFFLLQVTTAGWTHSAACSPVVHSILLHSGALVYSEALKSCCFGLGAESLFCSFDISELKQDGQAWLFDRWIFFTVELRIWRVFFSMFFLTVRLLLY